MQPARIASIELRAPLLGLFNRREMYGALPVEVGVFADAGVAWTSERKPGFLGGEREWVRSVGATVRVNVFGYAIGELDYVRPLDRPGRGWMWQFNLTPGSSTTPITAELRRTSGDRVHDIRAWPEGVPLAEASDMTRPQLLTGALVMAFAVTAACSRADTKQEAREAAAEVKAAAARAGERLTDGWVTAKVQAKFFGDEAIKARYIDVSTRDGTVTLKGFVESDTVRQRALQIARTTDGAQQVNDQLLIGQAPRTVANRPAATGPGNGDVQPPGGTNIDDSTVTSLIQAKYFVDPSIKVRNVDVSVSAGVVTLRGRVASDSERAQALLLARTTHGVQRVEDSLTVDASLAPAGAPGQAAALSSTPIPGASAATGTPAAIGTSGVHPVDAGLEAALKSRLADDARLKSASIDVSARDGVVLLQGRVATAAAKQRALTLARETDGVVQVVDRLTVK